MLRSPSILCMVLGTVSGVASAQVAVRVEPANLGGPRPLEKQTAATAIQYYLQTWQSLQSAFDQNRAELLDADFVGDAREKLGKAIQEQAALGLHTHYRDRAHDLQIVFYSPEGLSIELTDDAEYDVEIFNHDKSETTQHVHARYVAVLTPSESRWRVRVFQTESEDQASKSTR